MHSKLDVLFTQFTGRINTQQTLKYSAQFLFVSAVTLEKKIQIPEKNCTLLKFVYRRQLEEGGGYSSESARLLPV